MRHRFQQQFLRQQEVHTDYYAQNTLCQTALKTYCSGRDRKGSREMRCLDSLSFRMPTRHASQNQTQLCLSKSSQPHSFIIFRLILGFF